MTEPEDRLIEPLPSDLAEPADVVEAVRARRGGRLLNIDRMLLHSPEFVRGWLVFVGGVRTKLGLSRRRLELAICVTAAVNDAGYEVFHHLPLLAREGVTPEQLQAVAAAGSNTDWSLFDADEQAIIQAAVAITRDGRLDPEAAAALKRAMPTEGERFELVGAVAAYTMVSRVITSLDIQPER